MLFDTLKLADDLQESFTPEQARTLARVLSSAGTEQFATKADLAELRNEFKSDINELRSDVNELRSDISGLKNDISDLKLQMAAFKNEFSVLRVDTIRWIVMALCFNVGTIIATTVAIVKLVGR